MLMTLCPLLAVSLVMKIVAGLFLSCAVVLILTILIQKGRGGGLGAAFGGGAASGILGSKTGDFLTWVTIVMASVFLTLAVVMAKFYRPDVTEEFDSAAPAQQEQPVEADSSVGTEQAAPAQPNEPIGGAGGPVGSNSSSR